MSVVNLPGYLRVFMVAFLCLFTVSSNNAFARNTVCLTAPVPVVLAHFPDDAPPEKYQRKEGDAMAVVAFILSLVGVFAPVAILLGYIARKKLRKSGGKRLKLAEIAIILGWLTFIGPALGLLIMLMPYK